MPLASQMSRRAFLRRTVGLSASLGLGALLAACSGQEAVPTAGPTSAPAGATTAPAGAATAPAGAAAPTTAAAPAVSGSGRFSGRLLIWGIVSFTKEGDALLGQQMADWGKQNGVQAEYVPLNGSDYDQKLAAAVETGALPDVVMLGGTNTIYYAAQNRLVDLSDVFNGLKGLSGGMWDSLLPNVQADGKTYAIPMQADTSVLYTRLDLCERATGKRAAPATIDEMETIMRKVNDPPKQFGYGMCLGRTPDANGDMTALLLADGGTLVDKDGNPAIRNEGTISALTRVQGWWRDKLIPPDSPSWDDSANNKSYLTRQAAFVTNPASIFAALEKDDKPLLADTAQAPYPKGRAGSFPSAGTWAWGIFSTSKNIDAGKAMITTIMQPDKVQAVYEKVGGRWYPVYKDLSNAPWWKERTYFNDFPTVLQTARPQWFPATGTPRLLSQLSAAGQKRIYAEMVQDVVVNNKSPQEAAQLAQTKMEQTFAEAAR